MKVLLVNGSPHAKGCTYTALCVIGEAFSQEGIECDIFQLGTKPISGCIACGMCRKLGKCCIDDTVNQFNELAKKADGFIFGTPVHYAAPAGNLTAFMDRVFFSATEKPYRLKPAAAIASARRAGTTSAFDQLNKYFSICEMPIISSNYWNMVFGQKPEDVLQDIEGLNVMRTLARNMAWFLKCKAEGEKNGIKMPEIEKKTSFNFIR